MTTTAATGLVARTREIDPPADLLAHLGPDGFAWIHDEAGVVTAGVAGRVRAEEAPAALRAMNHEDDVDLPGTGALAAGALPFRSTAHGSLVIPARVVGVAPDGTAWRTKIAPVDDVPMAPRAAPTRFEVRGRQGRDHWRAAVNTVLTEIDARRLAKAVLAREVTVDADVAFDPRAVLARLAASSPGCFVYGALSEPRQLVGASPELLVLRTGHQLWSQPLAGTAPREQAGALLESVKDDREHRYVIEAVVDTLRPLCEELRAAPHPEAVTFPSVVHLATEVTGRLREPAPSALELALALHPTPAVGGAPRDPAVELIERLEGFERGCYAGPVGWVDARGDGEWAVALRGAELEGTRARLVAGVGVVAGSDPDAEWAETEVKFEPMLRALVRP
ncbi:MAG TPA: isochorismate synthase [Acidimicrobiia bacterium]